MLMLKKIWKTDIMCFLMKEHSMITVLANKSGSSGQFTGNTEHKEIWWTVKNSIGPIAQVPQNISLNGKKGKENG